MSKLEDAKEVEGSHPFVYVFGQELRRPFQCAPPPPAPRERHKSGRDKGTDNRAPRGPRQRCLESVLRLAEYNQHDMVQHWKNQSSGHKKKAICRQGVPDGIAMESFHLNFRRWLRERQLQKTLQRDARWDPPASEGDPSYPFMYYRYVPPCTEENAHTEPEEGWSRAFHGTWFYALRSILRSGVLLESSSKERGHGFSIPGVYLAPSLSGSIWFARPHQVFDGDKMFHRVMLEVRYDPSKVMPLRGKVASRAVVVSSDAVAITGIIVQPNSPPYSGEERCENWDPSLEVIPRPFARRRHKRKRRRSKRERHARVVKSEECGPDSHDCQAARRDRRSLSSLRAEFENQVGNDPDELGRRPLRRRRNA
ncbi:unnamed protein product [Symbiodinium sp. CCMP2456]|nr:unnamed protein product [Symbiodinium sp. CCMP2456]